MLFMPFFFIITISLSEPIKTHFKKVNYFYFEGRTFLKVTMECLINNRKAKKSYVHILHKNNLCCIRLDELIFYREAFSHSP